MKNDPSLSHIPPVTPGSDVFTSGRRVLSEETAESLIGGTVCFHRSQSAPSSFGGTILKADKTHEGEAAGRFILTFRFDPAYQGIKTSREGCSQEMKLVP
jgi:hypothetical protein